MIQMEWIILSAFFSVVRLLHWAADRAISLLGLPARSNFTFFFPRESIQARKWFVGQAIEAKEILPAHRMEGERYADPEKFTLGPAVNQFRGKMKRLDREKTPRGSIIDTWI